MKVPCPDLDLDEHGEQECLYCDGSGYFDAEVVPTTQDIVQAIRALYEINGVGGAVHIVTDDDNLEDEHLEFCAKEIADDKHWSFETEGAREAAKRVCDLMTPMTVKQRATALEMYRQNHAA